MFKNKVLFLHRFFSFLSNNPLGFETLLGATQLHATILPAQCIAVMHCQAVVKSLTDVQARSLWEARR